MLRRPVMFPALFGVIVVTVCGLTVASSTPPEAGRSGVGPSAVGQSEVGPAAVAAKGPAREQIVVSFSGDTILGTDDAFAAESSLPARWEQSGRSPDHFFRNVVGLFATDDLTVANVEVALTRSREKRYKGEGEVYHFHGDPALAATLPAGGIDVATVANNHTFDYGQKGFADTVAALRDVGIGVFGAGYAGEGSQYDLALIREVKGVRLGFVGYQAWTDDENMIRKIRADFAGLRAAGADVVIPYFHWGIESEHLPYSVQTNLARVAVDAGADLVVGTHPHVIQSLEIYRGTLIAYSFGNFAFGGNSNPSDKRAYILQTRFTTVDGSVEGVDFRVLPTRVSSTEAHNDYVPTPYTGAQRTEVLEFINSLSPTLDGRVRDVFEPVTPAQPDADRPAVPRPVVPRPVG